MPPRQNKIIEENKCTYLKIFLKNYLDKLIPNFGDAILNGLVTMDVKNDEQNELSQRIREFLSNTWPKISNMKKEKENVKNSAMTIE